MDKHHKIALVTGAGRGIGRAIALRLALAGYHLSLTARTREELEETRRLSGLAPELSLIVLADLTDSEAPANIFDATIEHFGRIDLLVNNAGGAPPRTQLIKMSEADIDRVLMLNLRAPMALTRLAARHMTERRGGVIINIASIAAETLAAGESAYAAAKSGLVAFGRACANELRESDVKVSTIIPGLTDTALIPENKRLDRSLMLQPADVAEAVMTVLTAPLHVCPREIVLQPAREPIKTR